MNEEEVSVPSTLDLEKEQTDNGDMPVDIDPETEKRGGMKEIATNNDAISVEKTKLESESIPDEVALPSFFIKKADKHRVEIDILSSKIDGQVMSISRAGLGLDFSKDFSYLKHTPVWFDFSLPNYEDMTTYRQRSAVYRRDAQQMIVDKLQLRNFIIVWHLKDWSLTDENGNKVDLEHDDNGALSDKSLAQVYAVMPTLMDVVLTVIEKDLLLTA